MYIYVRVYMYSMFKLSFYISLKHIKNIQIIDDHIDLVTGKDLKLVLDLPLFSSSWCRAPPTAFLYKLPRDPARLDREIIGRQGGLHGHMTFII